MWSVVKLEVNYEIHTNVIGLNKCYNLAVLSLQNGYMYFQKLSRINIVNSSSSYAPTGAAICGSRHAVATASLDSGVPDAD